MATIVQLRVVTANQDALKKAIEKLEAQLEIEPVNLPTRPGRKDDWLVYINWVVSSD